MKNPIMPVLFVGHGSPLNAINNSAFAENWQKIADSFPKPRAILAISAHWSTNGQFINNAMHPQQIYDMYGFPKALYDLKYPAPGSPELVESIRSLIPDINIDNTWGIDHGIWSILTWMYPNADIPVVEMSINASVSLEASYQFAQQLAPLSEQGVLILASGNIVHNLRLVNWESKACDHWATDFDDALIKLVESHDVKRLFNYRQLPNADKAVPTIEHLQPLYYALGAAGKDAKVTLFNHGGELGSISMSSFIFQKNSD